MELNVDLTELHKAASRMLPARNVTEKEAFEAGKDSALNGADQENCHYSFFESSALADAWERGKASYSGG